jgi:hypothetical protein
MGIFPRPRRLHSRRSLRRRWPLQGGSWHVFRRHTGVIKKTVLAITTTTTMVATVTSNLTLEELVKLMDMSVASKYGADLTQFTRIIVDDMCNTL